MSKMPKTESVDVPQNRVRVFVYGTLLRGYGNYKWALASQTFVGEAETKPEYTMLHLGGFPGVIEGGSTAIKGEVFEITEACLRSLDGLEGVNHNRPEMGLYRRETITLTDGQEVMTYIYNGRHRDDAVIESGSWHDAVAERNRRWEETKNKYG